MRLLTLGGLRLLLLVGVACAGALSSMGTARAQAPLYTFTTPNPQSYASFGSSVAAGDVNGDGKADIIVGAVQETIGGNAYQGRVYVLSGADGSFLYTLTTPNPQYYAYFGEAVAAGDVNGDGKADIIVGAFGEAVGGNDQQGRIYVFFGADGSLLYTLTSPNPQGGMAHFGEAVAAGDVNGDGRADIIVGAQNEVVGGNDQGRVYVFSGTDASLLHTLTTPNAGVSYFGGAVATADVNGDGKADIIVGAVGETVGGNDHQGRAYVFSGADGSLLHTLNTANPQPSAFFGSALAAGDVNGDGKADIIVGAYPEAVYQGRVYVFSGADGSLLYTLNTPNPQAYGYFGEAVAAADANSDGKADIIVGAETETVAGNSQQGRVYVFSGTDGSLLYTLTTPNPPSADFGGAVATADVDGDGKPDIIVGAPGETVGGNAGQGRVYVFSGADLYGGPPTIVLSPLVGKVQVGISLGDCSGLPRWCFEQHPGVGLHTVNGGICGSDDTWAWDTHPFPSPTETVPVYPAAPGKIVAYAGAGCDSSGLGAVLIEHGSGAGVWWSGYLHMASIPNFTLGQPVDTSTILGIVSNVATTDRHLHFVVYAGTNALDSSFVSRLVSFNVQIVPRLAQSSLTAPAGAGTSILQIRDVSVYSLADTIRINPGGANQEDRTITGFGSLILNSPLQLDHAMDEPVVVISRTSPSVGGIAESPDVAALRSGASSGVHRTAYALGGTALVAVAAIGAAGWYVCRKRAA